MIVTNFTLPERSGVVWQQSLHIDRPGKKAFSSAIALIEARSGLKAILYANPTTFGVVLLALLKIFRLVNRPIFIFDLILKYPSSATERCIAHGKGFFLRRFERVIAIHKDTSGYEKYYGLRADQFIYVPFKANNFDSANDGQIKEGDYIVSLGASQRDYPTFIAAAAQIGVRAVIVCSDEGAINNNADVGNVEDYPPNLHRIRDYIPSAVWYQWLAESLFVVVPIKATAIQPAGISVYLEAMRLRKATIVSAGASANKILDNEENALVVPAGDPIALAQAMQRLINDLQLRKRIAENGFAYARLLGNDSRMRSDIADVIIKNLSQDNIR